MNDRHPGGETKKATEVAMGLQLSGSRGIFPTDYLNNTAAPTPLQGLVSPAFNEPETRSPAAADPQHMLRAHRPTRHVFRADRAIHVSSPERRRVRRRRSAGRPRW